MSNIIMKKFRDLQSDEIKNNSHYVIKNNYYTLTCTSSQSTLVRNSDRNELMMDNQTVLNLYSKSLPEFKGDVLAVGLGFGLFALNFAHQCNSFTYIELDQHLIDFMKPMLPKKCEYIQGDAFEWTTTKKYDVIFLDIFHKKPSEYNKKIIQLYNKYKVYLKEDGIIRYLYIHGISPI